VAGGLPRPDLLLVARWRSCEYPDTGWVGRALPARRSFGPCTLNGKWDMAWHLALGCGSLRRREILRFAQNDNWGGASSSQSQRDFKCLATGL
jgi:hypothetical protein